MEKEETQDDEVRVALEKARFDQFLLVLTEMKANIKMLVTDVGKIESHLKEINGSVVGTRERLIVVETQLEPVKTMVSRVVWAVISSFLLALGYVVYKK